jgi:hypothetical protein
LDEKVLVFLKNETKKTFEEFSFEFIWPEDDDFSKIKRCEYDQYLNDESCQQC